MAFVLVEWYINGCDAKFVVRGVTSDQQTAYNWYSEQVPEFVQRQIQNAPFL